MAFDENAGVISYLSLKRSSGALYVFLKVHLRYHDIPKDFFNHFGIWTTVEALVYSADTTNEAEGGFEEACRGLEPIGQFLESLGFLDDQTAAELDRARSYFALERRFMQGKASVEDIRRTAVLRSFDFRLLHRLIFRLKGWPYDEPVFAGLAKLEEAIEYDDDSTSIARDREAGTFNVLSALCAHGNQELARYGADLVEGAQAAIDILGPRFVAVLQTYHALVPGTVLAPLLA